MPPPSDIVLRPLTAADHAETVALWRATEGLGLGESDTAEAIAAFLARNEGLSPVAVDGAGRIVGAMLCGHDGRRGYLHHLAVARERRGQGIGKALVEFAVAGLRREGIPKCNLFIFDDNAAGRAFWEHLGWRRPVWQVMQKPIDPPSQGCGSPC
jgi:putative acetyltransferase